MFADRDRYSADPAFVGVNADGLLDPGYLDQRAALIGTEAGEPPLAGSPPNVPARAPDKTRETAGTSHFIIRDRAGNVVSMTTTVESIFGSGRMADGFFLNNQMTDFSFAPTDPSGLPVANAVAPGKRPRSAMTPLILLDAQGNFAGAIGSAGGPVDPDLCRQVAGRGDRLGGCRCRPRSPAPNLVARGKNFNGEVTKFSPEILRRARRKEASTSKPRQGEDSGVQGVLIRDGKIDGGFDPRREGVVLTLP